MNAAVRVAAARGSFASSQRHKWAAEGYRVVAPGDAWAGAHVFSKQDWRADSFIAVGPALVVMPLIVAMAPREGAFTRLVRGIGDMTLCPVVCDPLDAMEAILTGWGWSTCDAMVGGEHSEWWWPRDPDARPLGRSK